MPLCNSLSHEGRENFLRASLMMMPVKVPSRVRFLGAVFDDAVIVIGA